MTKVLLTCVFAAVTFTACDQQPPPSEIVHAPDVPSLAEEKPLVTPPTPPPIPAPTVELAPPPAKPTVGSTVWAIARISITTDEGIMAIPAGSKLRVVRESETGYVVTDEKQEFPVTGNQVSLNSNTASNAAMAEAAARSANAALQQTQAAANAKRHQNAMSTQAIANLQNTYDQLTREEANLQASLKRAQAEDFEAVQAANRRRVYSRSITPQQVAAWSARLHTVQAEKTRTYWDLKKAQQ